MSMPGHCNRCFRTSSASLLSSPTCQALQGQSLAVTFLNCEQDGYTFFYSPPKSPPAYSTSRDSSKSSLAGFTLIMPTAMFTPATSIHPDALWKTLEALLADARKTRKEITVATAGVATSLHLVALMPERCAGVKFTLASFAGGRPAITATLGEHVAVTSQSVPRVVGYVRSGRLRAVAVLTNQRVEAAPDLPSVGEVIPMLKPDVRWGVVTAVAPKDTPDDVVAKLRDSMTVILLAVSSRSEQFRRLVSIFAARVQRVNKRSAWQTPCGSACNPGGPPGSKMNPRVTCLRRADICLSLRPSRERSTFQWKPARLRVAFRPPAQIGMVLAYQGMRRRVQLPSHFDTGKKVMV